MDLLRARKVFGRHERGVIVARIVDAAGGFKKLRGGFQRIGDAAAQPFGLCLFRDGQEGIAFKDGRHLRRVCAGIGGDHLDRLAVGGPASLVLQIRLVRDIDGLDEATVEALRERAKNALTTLALAQEESLGDNKPADDLLNLEGLDRALAFKLAARGVCTLEDLAEQGVDDLADIEGMTDEKAGELIMAARNICWFGDEA
jgi:transcription termination factor NusA